MAVSAAPRASTEPMTPSLFSPVQDQHAHAKEIKEAYSPRDVSESSLINAAYLRTLDEEALLHTAESILREREVSSLGLVLYFFFDFCDNSMREKDWRCCKRGTQAM